MGTSAIEGLRYSERRTEPPEYMVLTDQHGREWGAEMHIRTMTWVGPLLLLNASPPVDIPAKYVEPVIGENKRPVVGKVFVNERRWLRDIRRRMNEWTEALAGVARQMYPNNYGEMMAKPSLDLLKEVGPGPIDQRFVEAMIAGNKWALGLTQKRPSWVDEDMLAGARAIKRTTGWRETVGEANDEINAALYPDADEDAGPTFTLADDTSDDAPKPKVLRPRKHFPED